MQQMTIVISAVGMMLIGAAVIYYQHTGARRFDLILIVAGIALVAGGIAMLRDGLEGRHKFIWMLPSVQGHDHQG